MSVKASNVWKNTFHTDPKCLNSNSDQCWRNKSVFHRKNTISYNSAEKNFILNQKISLNTSIEDKQYLCIKTVFKYVTLGGEINKKDYIELQEWVRRSVESYFRQYKLEWDIPKIIVESRNENGSMRIDRIYHYNLKHYPMIAKACINWANLHKSNIIFKEI
jgi:hypothetical protein